MTGVVVTERLMQLTAHLPRRFTLFVPSATQTVAFESDQTRDAARGACTEDRALYACTCGYAFKASVSTSVDCPNCGIEQAW